ncbi:MAG: hypothetical protein H6895_13850 [Defluviimonas sp.]|uniref:DUF5666 domain-containing protein n=1 Tax=Albidovulum sp. TaxID=1872424 RepID=UPI001D65DBF0|nr:hypothetical protein [Paracoccaceae bacterium]MCC0065147.1 hypothetical protein [Defluviimonas sp.]
MKPLTLVALAFLAAGQIFPGQAVADSSKAQTKEGGIIGTGIVGIVTDLGSIWVNGQHIRYDPGTEVEGPFGTRPASALRPGDCVAVLAEPEGDGWRALSIREMRALVGPVETVGAGHLTVMGIAVDTKGAKMTATPKTGDWVAVSGLWKEDGVMASKVDPAPGDMAMVSGSFSDAGGIPRVGAVTLDGIRPHHARPGDVMTAMGHPGTGTIDAETVELGIFAQEPGTVIAQGYLSRPVEGGFYTLLGSGLVAFAQDPEMTVPDAPLLYCGKGDRLGTPVIDGDASVCME